MKACIAEEVRPCPAHVGKHYAYTTISLREHWFTHTSYADCYSGCNPAVASVILIEISSKDDAIALRLRSSHTWTDSGDSASSVSGSAGVPKPARRTKLPKVMYGRKVAPVALPSNTKPGAPIAPNLPAYSVQYVFDRLSMTSMQVAESS